MGWRNAWIHLTLLYPTASHWLGSWITCHEIQIRSGTNLLIVCSCSTSDLDFTHVVRRVVNVRLDSSSVLMCAGIAIRFFNSKVQGDNLKTAADVSALLSRVNFEGKLLHTLFCTSYCSLTVWTSGSYRGGAGLCRCRVR